MKSVNTVVLSGNLTQDPERKETSGGTVICSLRLAVNMREKKGEDWEDRPSFFDVTVFGRQAESCAEHLAKGRGVIIEGNLRQDRWQNDSGDNRQAVKVIARNVVFVGGKGDGDGSANGAATKEEPPAQSPSEGLPSGKTPATEENIKRLCLCKPGYTSEDCPIEGHGVPF